MNKALLTTKDASSLIGCSQSTLRNYEAVGLLVPAVKVGNRRYYASSQVTDFILDCCSGSFLDIFDNAVVKYESDLKQGNYFFEFDGCMLYTHSSVVTTRKPSRIKPVIRKLEELWRKYPDLRLGQLLIDCAGDKDLFNLEDDELLEAMERFGDNL